MVFLVGEKPSAEIILVPAGHNQYDAAARLQACNQVGAVPVPYEVSVIGIVCLRMRFDWVIDYRQVSAAARDGPADAN